MEGQPEVNTSDLDPSVEDKMESQEASTSDLSQQADEGHIEVICDQSSDVDSETRNTDSHIEVICNIKDLSTPIAQDADSEGQIEVNSDPDSEGQVEVNSDPIENEPKTHIKSPNSDPTDSVKQSSALKPSDVGSKVTFSPEKGSKGLTIEVMTPDPSPGGLIFKGVTVSMGNTPILQDVCGMCEEGKLLAIMGPSGAGKTTLLNVLSGRLPVTDGEISLNGMHISKKIRRKISYVLQEDIFFPSLTLRETLQFAASIRLPDTLSHDQKMSRLDDIVSSLELSRCLDTLMGGPMMPGLSGGERKRASIACELLTNPWLILLDEPTTGLDSSSAAGLMKSIKDYAISHNKIVVSTIHQPSTSLFYLFDDLLLLSQGQTAYYGLTADVIQYFRSIHLPIQPGFNPADFILDKMKNSEIVQQQIIESCKDLRRSDQWPQALKGKAQQYIDDPESPSMLMGFNFKSPSRPFWNRCCSKEIEKAEYDVGTHLIEENVVAGDKFLTSFCTQYKHLVIRTFKQSKPRILDKLKLLENLLICAIFCLIWFQLPRSEDTLRDRMGAIFFIAIHWGFMPFFDATSSFPMEQVVIHKERSGGWYRLSAYYLAKMTSELPLIFAQPLLFLSIAYWTIGLNGAVAFFATVGTVFIDSLAGQSIGLFLGIISKEMRQAITISILIEMSIMLLGGLFTRNLPFWLDWLKYISFLHYSFHCLLIIEFQNGPPIMCSENRNTSVFVECRNRNTTSVPSHLALEYFDVSWSFWQYFVMLFVFIPVFRILGYIMLRFVNKPH